LSRLWGVITTTDQCCQAVVEARIRVHLHF